MNPQVTGASIINIINGCHPFETKARKILASHNITKIDINEWYDLNKATAAIKEIDKEFPSMLNEIGKNVPKNSKFPAGIDSFDKALQSLNTAYQMNHRNGDVGNYTVDLDGFGCYRVSCKTKGFYPPNYNLGIIKGLSRRFGAWVKIEQVSSKEGGEFIVHVLSEKTHHKNNE